MVAALAAPTQSRNVRLVTEIRGAVARLFDEGHGQKVVCGSAGTGKTRSILEWIHQRCSTERIRVLFLRKVAEDLKSSALVTYTEQVLHEFDGKRSDLDGVTYFGGNKLRPAQFTYDATGSVIVTGGLNNPGKIFSTEYDVIYVNEATDLSLDDWEKLSGRTNRPSMDTARPPSLLLGDCNPGPPTHWIKTRADAGLLELWPSYHEDNPAMWDRKAKRWTVSGQRYFTEVLDKLTGVRRERLRDGVWAAAEGRVFDLWDRRTHVIRRDQLATYGLESPKRYIGGVDWGWTKPGVISIAGIGGDGQMGILREVYQTRRGRDWWIAKAKEFEREFNIDRWVCDPSEPELIQAWVDAGLTAVGAVNDILPGVLTLQDRMQLDGSGRSRFVVVEDCNQEPDQSLIDAEQPISGLQEVDSYIWTKNATGKKEKPVDADNHALDTWRYLAMEADGIVGEMSAVSGQLKSTLDDWFEQ